MDLASIQFAFTGLKTVTDLLQGAVKLKVENATLEAINDALTKVSSVRDALFEAQSEMFRLNEENHQLRQQMREHENWEAKEAQYKLVQTEGGAFVYTSVSDSPKHYACPGCMSKRSIGILQDLKSASGMYQCPNKDCKTHYGIRPRRVVTPSGPPSPWSA